MGNLEEDIQHWLKKSLPLDQMTDLVCKSMLKDLKTKKSKSLSSGFSFLIRSDQAKILFQFVFEHMDSALENWPWSHLMEASLKMEPEVQFKIVPWLLEGASNHQVAMEFYRNCRHEQAFRELQNMEALATVPGLESSNFLNLLTQWHTQRLKQKESDILQSKKRLIEQYQTLRSQQLYDPEKKMLARLELTFPNHPDIRELVFEHKKRYADEFLRRRLRVPRSSNEAGRIQARSPTDQQWEEMMTEAHLNLGLQNKSLKKDLIVSCLILDLPQAAHEVLQKIPSDEDLSWLSLEVLLAAGRHADLLDRLPQIEFEKASNSETFFATAYFRAQAYFGLGQKGKAIEVLEGLLASRPDYRSADALLNFWRSP